MWRGFLGAGGWPSQKAPDLFYGGHNPRGQASPPPPAPRREEDCRQKRLRQKSLCFAPAPQGEAQCSAPLVRSSGKGPLPIRAKGRGQIQRHQVPERSLITKGPEDRIMNIDSKRLRREPDEVIAQHKRPLARHCLSVLFSNC